jgi:hypothetical protein
VKGRNGKRRRTGKAALHSASEAYAGGLLNALNFAAKS